MNADLDAIRDHPYLRHYALCKPAEFDQYTPATFFEAADNLAEQHGRIAKAAFADLELAYGLNYEPHGLIFDRAIRPLYNPIDHNMPDAMHVLAASGGAAPREVAAFLDCAVRTEGLALSSLDEWVQAHVKSEANSGKLGRSFFQDRVTIGSGKELANTRFFAAECLNVVAALVLFFQCVYQPAGIMLAQGHCLQHLKEMLDIAFCGDNAVRHVEALQRATEQHHKLFNETYELGYQSSKFHSIYHLVEKIRVLRFAGNCFAAEGMHKMSQAFAKHCPGAGREAYMAKRYLLDVLEDCERRVISECHLVSPAFTPDLAATLLQFMPRLAACSVESSKKMSCRFGELRQKDLVAVSDEAGVVQIGAAMFFLAGRNDLAPEIFYFICLQPYARLAPGLFAACDRALLVRPYASLEAVLTYAVRGNGVVKPLLPWHLKGRV